MRDVADDRDFQIIQPSFSLANREGVKQRLRGMFVRAVSAIDDRSPWSYLASVCGAPEAVCRMTTQSAAMASSVFAVSIRVSPLQTLLVEKLTVNDVCRQPLPCNFERRAGAGGSFEEEIDDGLSAKRGNFFDRARRNFLKGFGSVENLQNLFAAEVLDSQQIFSLKHPASLDLLHDIDRVFAVDFASI